MNNLQKIQAIAIALIVIISEYMVVAAFNHSWYAIGIVFVINLIVLTYIIEVALNKEE